MHRYSTHYLKIFLQFLLLSNILFAQSSKLQIIGKPEKSTSEIVAVRDANGKFCAGIQVISDLDGFSYDSYNGIVKVDGFVKSVNHVILNEVSGSCRKESQPIIDEILRCFAASE